MTNTGGLRGNGGTTAAELDAGSSGSPSGRAGASSTNVCGDGGGACVALWMTIVNMSLLTDTSADANTAEPTLPNSSAPPDAVPDAGGADAAAAGN